MYIPFFLVPIRILENPPLMLPYTLLRTYMPNIRFLRPVVLAVRQSVTQLRKSFMNIDDDFVSFWRRTILCLLKSSSPIIGSHVPLIPSDPEQYATW